MNINIRRTVREDCPRLMELIRELALFEKAPEQVIVTNEHFEECGFGENPAWQGFVAEVDGKVEGCALYYIRYSTWKGRRLYLEDLVVSEEKRGLGLGTLLFERLLRETREGNFTGMAWQVLDWNEPAITFYKKYKASIDSGWLNCNIDV